MKTKIKNRVLAGSPPGSPLGTVAYAVRELLAGTFLFRGKVEHRINIRQNVSILNENRISQGNA